MFGVVASEVKQGALLAAQRHENVDSRGSGTLGCDLVGEHVFQRLAILELHGKINVARNVGLADIQLLEQGREKIAGVESDIICTEGQLLPEEFAAVEDVAAAHVKQVPR